MWVFWKHLGLSKHNWVNYVCSCELLIVELIYWLIVIPSFCWCRRRNSWIFRVEVQTEIIKANYLEECPLLHIETPILNSSQNNSRLISCNRNNKRISNNNSKNSHISNIKHGIKRHHPECHHWRNRNTLSSKVCEAERVGLVLLVMVAEAKACIIKIETILMLQREVTSTQRTMSTCLMKNYNNNIRVIIVIKITFSMEMASSCSSTMITIRMMTMSLTWISEEISKKRKLIDSQNRSCRNRIRCCIVHRKRIRLWFANSLMLRMS